LQVTDRTHTEDGTVLTVKGPESVLDDPALAVWYQCKI